ncbi:MULTISPECIES: hypothetical protein [unclassified Knoellia]|uniref:hypothetical protein n=1 Tax=Knoellia altitudinis TaxID=3404795 RepID=UPI00360D50FA
MRSDLSPPFDPTTLRLAGDVRRLGRDTNEKDDQGRPVWVRVRHGVVVRAATWRQLTVEQRHAAFVHATALRMKAPPAALSHTSAAALWGLPRVSAWPTRLEVISSARSSGLIVRHDLPRGETVHVAGLSVTSLTRTLVDLGRTEKLHDAVAAADHALHHELCTAIALEEEFDRLDAGVPGRARARLALDLADGRSMSVGESLSRVQMFRLNLPRPELQVEVHDGDGLVGFCDFGWEDVMGEFDGRKKYGLRDGMDPQKAERTLWNEKKREDRIRATNRKMARWVWVDALRPSQMARILAAQGIRPSAVNTWFVGEMAARHPRHPRHPEQPRRPNVA